MQIHPFFSNRKVAFLLASLACVLWGSAYPAIKSGHALFQIVRSSIPSQMIFAGYRMFLAGLVLLIIAFFLKKPIFRLTKNNLKHIMALGLFQTAIHYTVFYIGVANTTGVKSSVLNSTTVFFSVLLAHFIYKNDQLTPAKVFGYLAGFVGVMAVNFHSSLFDFQFSLMGEGAIIVAALMFSTTTMYGRYISQNMDSMVLTGYQLSFGGAVLLIFGYPFGGQMAEPTFSSSLLMAYLVLISSTTFALWTALLKYNRVGLIAVFNFIIPIAGVLLSGFFLGESILEIKNFIALVLVCSGIYFVTKEPKQKAS